MTYTLPPSSRRLSSTTDPSLFFQFLVFFPRACVRHTFPCFSNQKRASIIFQPINLTHQKYLSQCHVVARMPSYRMMHTKNYYHHYCCRLIAARAPNLLPTSHALCYPICEPQTCFSATRFCHAQTSFSPRSIWKKKKKRFITFILLSSIKLE